ncbi:pre-mRNA-splicing regulator WTAP [Uranotaenia lowii]|uniref:pre-mRNA-splicing regulator WTAP n=1 Tax=Uranotaenia lowii TaxID=190385 RepID=UPI00247937F8|nr:pre-mRNA-splicing regulator WTAP [Uranotaenia lowii]
MQDYASQIAELKAAQAPGQAALRSALLDPAVNILFQKLKGELQQTKAKLEETQNELSAWKFTPDSNTGKRLMAKCRLLYQENEELGKMTSNGRLAKLEGELALQKSYNEEVKKSQLELDDFLQEMDEDVEGMQSTIVFLQQELKHTKDEKESLEKEVLQLRSYVNGVSGGGASAGLEDGTDPSSFQQQQQLVNGSKLKLNSAASNCPSGGVGVVGGLVVGDQQSESQFSVYQNRTHCVGGGTATSGGNADVLQNGGCDDNELGEQESAGQNSSRLCASKKVNSRTAKSVGGKKRNYQEDPDDETGVGGEDEEDSGHYEDGSNNGKMLAPDSDLAHDSEEPSVLSSSNKRMTRSGKGSKIALGKPIVSVKKLRRASVLSGEDDEMVEGSNGAN